MMWYDAMRCDAIRYDMAMWCDVMWCDDIISYHIIYDVMWCDMIWKYMVIYYNIWCDVMWCDVMWYDCFVTWHNRNRFDVTVTLWLCYRAKADCCEKLLPNGVPLRWCWSNRFCMGALWKRYGSTSQGLLFFSDAAGNVIKWYYVQVSICTRRSHSGGVHIMCFNAILEQVFSGGHQQGRMSF